MLGEESGLEAVLRLKGRGRRGASPSNNMDAPSEVLREVVLDADDLRHALQGGAQV